MDERELALCSASMGPWWIDKYSKGYGLILATKNGSDGANVIRRDLATGEEAPTAARHCRSRRARRRMAGTTLQGSDFDTNYTGGIRTTTRAQ